MKKIYLILVLLLSVMSFANAKPDSCDCVPTTIDTAFIYPICEYVHGNLGTGIDSVVSIWVTIDYSITVCGGNVAILIKDMRLMDNTAYYFAYYGGYSLSPCSFVSTNIRLHETCS